MKKRNILLLCSLLVLGGVSILENSFNNSDTALANDSLANDDYHAEIGNGATGTWGVEDNYYKLHITESDGVDWHAKFWKGIYVDKDIEYTAKFTFDSTSAGEVVLNGETKNIEVGQSIVERTLHSSLANPENNRLEFEIQFGRLESGTIIKIYSVEFTTRRDEQFIPSDYSFIGKNKGWGYDLESATDENLVVKSQINAEGNETWRDQLIIETGINLPAGQYRLFADIVSNHNKTIEMVSGIEGSDEDFKKVAEFYGINLLENEVTTIGGETKNLSEQIDNVVLRFSIGAHSTEDPDTLTISNIRISKVNPEVIETKTLTFETQLFKFINDWKALRAEGGESGICTLINSEEMTRLLNEYDSLSDEDKLVLTTTEDDGCSIADSINYVKSIRENAELKKQENISVVNHNNSSSVMLLAVLGGLLVASISSYCLITKKKYH